MPPYCRFFQLGRCKNGEACPFSHDRNHPDAHLCFFFLEGNCRHGDRCMYDHHRPAASAAPSLTEGLVPWSTPGGTNEPARVPAPQRNGVASTGSLLSPHASSFQPAPCASDPSHPGTFGAPSNALGSAASDARGAHRPLCVYFLQGNCHQGPHCRFRHALPDTDDGAPRPGAGSSAAAAHSPDTCPWRPVHNAAPSLATSATAIPSVAAEAWPALGSAPVASAEAPLAAVADAPPFVPSSRSRQPGANGVSCSAAGAIKALLPNNPLDGFISTGADEEEEEDMGRVPDPVVNIGTQPVSRAAEAAPATAFQGGFRMIDEGANPWEQNAWTMLEDPNQITWLGPAADANADEGEEWQLADAHEAAADPVAAADTYWCQEHLFSGTCSQPACPLVHGEQCVCCSLFCLHTEDEGLRAEHEDVCGTQQEQMQAKKLTSEMECVICQEVVVQKRPPSERQFGLLNCVHCICLACARQWRKTEASEARSCPVCRVVTHFITPSTVWPSSREEKQGVIEGYKQHLSTKHCRHFDFGRGTCPFGTSCFYRHEFEDGSLQDRRPKGLRRAVDADGNVRVMRPVQLASFLTSRR